MNETTTTTTTAAITAAKLRSKAIVTAAEKKAAEINSANLEKAKAESKDVKTPESAVSVKLHKYLAISDDTGKVVKNALKASDWNDKAAAKAYTARCHAAAAAIADTMNDPENAEILAAAAAALNSIASYWHVTGKAAIIQFGAKDVNYIVRHASGTIRFTAENGKISITDRNRATASIMNVVYIIAFCKLNRRKMPVAITGKDYDKFMNAIATEEAAASAKAKEAEKAAAASAKAKAAAEAKARKATEKADKARVKEAEKAAAAEAKAAAASAKAKAERKAKAIDKAAAATVAKAAK